MSSNKSIAPLTFGVEFEFIIKAIATDHSDPEPKDPRPALWDDSKYVTLWDGEQMDVYPQVSKAFTKYGIPHFTPHDSKRNAVLNKWHIQGDSSVTIDTAHQDSHYRYTDLEISSPIFYVSDEKDMGLDQIRRVVSIIRNEFRVHLPASAGFHCHVGNAEYGFTTSHMSNLQSILYVFDRQIQMLHPNRQPDTLEKQYTSDLYFCAPRRCNLGHYLNGEEVNPMATSTFDTNPDLSQEIIDPSSPIDNSSQPVEYSQAKRFLNKETRSQIARNHVRIRQMFASGPESMSGIGATNIKETEPGAIAQSLFRNDPTPIPTANLNPKEDLGPQLYTHLTQYLKRDLDPEIKNLLLTPNAKLDSPRRQLDPRLLLAPKILSRQPDLEQLDLCAGTGKREAAYNIHNLSVADRFPSIPKTMEFRQHQGTLDPERIVAWIQMVTGMVEWTRSASPVQIMELLKIGAEVRDVGEFDVVDLSRYMGLEEPAAYYEKEFFEAK